MNMEEEDALALFARGYTLTRAGSIQLKYSRNHGTQSHSPLRFKLLPHSPA